MLVLYDSFKSEIRKMYVDLSTKKIKNINKLEAGHRRLQGERFVPYWRQCKLFRAELLDFTILDSHLRTGSWIADILQLALNYGQFDLILVNVVQPLEVLSFLHLLLFDLNLVGRNGDLLFQHIDFPVENFLRLDKYVLKFTEVDFLVVVLIYLLKKLKRDVSVKLSPNLAVFRRS